MDEFVEDIIAATENNADANTDADANADANTDANADQNNADQNNAVADIDNSVDDSKSSSTNDASDDQKSDDESNSDDATNAPSGSSEVEELASQLGWNKNHTGPDVVDAKTFILRAKDIQKTMRTHNNDLKKQLNTLNSSVAALKEHNERVYQAEVRRLQGELDKLVKEKKDAIELADVDKVEELDQQIDQVKESIKAPKKDDASTDNPVFNEWVAENQWYLTDDEMAQYADQVAEQYVGAPPERIYALVRSKVQEVFPDKFDSTNDGRANNDANNAGGKANKKVNAPKSPVEGGARLDNKGSFTEADLTDSQKSVMRQFVQSGIMTKEQYIADIAKLQGV